MHKIKSSNFHFLFYEQVRGISMPEARFSSEALRELEREGQSLAECRELQFMHCLLKTAEQGSAHVLPRPEQGVHVKRSDTRCFPKE